MKKIVFILILLFTFTHGNTFASGYEFAKLADQASNENRMGDFMTLSQKIVKTNNRIGYVTKNNYNGTTTRGTAFAVDDNLILTNKHVIDNDDYSITKKSLRVHINGKTYKVRSVYLIKDKDLAIIKIYGKTRYYYNISAPKLKYKAPIYAYGYRWDANNLPAFYKNTGYFLQTHANGYSTYQMKFRSGMSGGPIFYKGQLVGISAFGINTFEMKKGPRAEREVAGGIIFDSKLKNEILRHR